MVERLWSEPDPAMLGVRGVRSGGATLGPGLTLLPLNYRECNDRQATPKSTATRPSLPERRRSGW